MASGGLRVTSNLQHDTPRHSHQQETTFQNYRALVGVELTKRLRGRGLILNPEKGSQIAAGNGTAEVSLPVKVAGGKRDGVG